MAHTFNYSILTAIPDKRRGERVNVGIAIFLPGGLDVRFTGIAKLRALTGNDWSAYATALQQRLTELYEPGQLLEDFNEQVVNMEQVVRLTEAAWFSIGRHEEYEDRVEEILQALVTRPRREPKPKETRINTEIAREFKKANVLASKEESIEDKKIVRNYIVSTEEDLRADFIFKNGAYHVTATLDLRRENVHIKEATWKAVVLDRAKAVLKGDTRRIGVYAAPPNAPQFRSHIRILGDYSDDVFNWADPSEHRQYVRAIYGAMRQSVSLYS